MIRKAGITDLDFMIQIDLENEGVTTSDSPKTEQELKGHIEICY
ncbi:hypothetical protein SAMN05661091_1661 [Paenibacillus uliginis N3/975]|uniref:Uncharacterized protein n=1 Tax=Paenibacillus uliginis N3/975 TaxID=1313296 RepID=A0A1X7H3F6_9BACL|nr:hypothetical protein [Paenibacillus uliginis]SMF79082.1 hypothetical protein SAMN05661091_1661 [Paenibacillus uliginis N3/975]